MKMSNSNLSRVPNENRKNAGQYPSKDGSEQMPASSFSFPNMEEAKSDGPSIRLLPSNQQAQIFEYRGHRVAGFQMSPYERFVCLPQLYDLFLKDFVGGLHTIYTKMKRLGIRSLVCCVEQVRVLRNFGAIQPGVNRCKLIEIADFEVLYEDCTNTGSKPGRPSKRIPGGGEMEETTIAKASCGLLGNRPSPPTPLQHTQNHSSEVAISSSRLSLFPSTPPASFPFLPDFLNAYGILPSPKQIPMAAPLNSPQIFSAFASAAQADSSQNNSQFAPHQLMFHRMAMAAAAIAMVQQEGGKGGMDMEGIGREREGEEEGGRERDQWRETTLLLNGDGEFSSSGTSSASTTMHGDLFEGGMQGNRGKEEQIWEAKEGGSLKLPDNSVKLCNSAKNSGMEVARKKDGCNGSSNERSMRGQIEEQRSPRRSRSNGDSSSGSASSESVERGRAAAAVDSMEMILERLNSVAERVENALKGHCEQHGKVSMQVELDLVKESERKVRMANKSERRKSEMFFRKYSKLKRLFHAERSRRMNAKMASK